MYPVRSSDELLQHTGQGDAGVFDPLNFAPMQHYLMQNAEDRRRQVAAKDDRDKQIANDLKYNHKGIFAPFTQEHNQKAAELVNLGAQIQANQITDPSHPLRIQYNNMRNELEGDVNKGEDYQKSFVAAHQQIDQDPYLKKDQARSAINDTLYNSEGQAVKSITDANPQDIQNELNHPRHFNLQSYAGAVSKDITPGVRSFLHNERLLGGVRTNEDEVKTLFHEYDDNGKLKLNPDGTPVIAVTPETKHIFYNKDPRAKAAVDYELNEQNKKIQEHNSLPENKYNQKAPVTEDDVIKQNISPYAYHQEKHSTGTLVKPTKYDEWKNKGKLEMGTARHTSLANILKGDKVEIANLSGGKYLGKRIEHIKVYPLPDSKVIPYKGGGRPKDVFHADITVENSDHRLETIHRVYDSPEEAYYELNNIYNTVEGQQKVSKEIVDKARGKNPMVGTQNAMPSDEEIINNINQDHPDATPEEKKAMYDDVVNSYQ